MSNLINKNKSLEKIESIREVCQEFKDKIENLTSEFEKENDKIKVLAGNHEGKVQISFFIEESFFD